MTQDLLVKNISQVEMWVTKWKPLLLMDRWEIHVTPLRLKEREAKNQAATYVDHHEYLYAEIGVTDQAFSRENSDVELLAVHELLHVMMSQVDANVYKIVDSLTSNATSALVKDFRRVFDDSTETLCEHLARVMVALERNGDVK